MSTPLPNDLPDAHPSDTHLAWTDAALSMSFNVQASVELTWANEEFYSESGVLKRLDYMNTLIVQDLHQEGFDPIPFHFHVSQQHGPSGGWPEVTFTGPLDQIERLLAVYLEYAIDPQDPDYGHLYAAAADRSRQVGRRAPAISTVSPAEEKQRGRHTKQHVPWGLY